MTVGEFDLSVGSRIGFAGVIIAVLSITLSRHMWLPILVTFAIFVGFGALIFGVV